MKYALTLLLMMFALAPLPLLADDPPPEAPAAVQVEPVDHEPAPDPKWAGEWAERSLLGKLFGPAPREWSNKPNPLDLPGGGDPNHPIVSNYDGAPHLRIFASDYGHKPRADP